jgi:hypothetical protein
MRCPSGYKITNGFHPVFPPVVLQRAHQRTVAPFNADELEEFFIFLSLSQSLPFVLAQTDVAGIVVSQSSWYTHFFSSSSNL